MAIPQGALKWSSVWVFTLAFLRRTSRPFPCRLAPGGNTQPSAAGGSRCRSKKSARALPGGRDGRNYWRLHAAGRSTWCWSGRWIHWGPSVADLLTTFPELEHLGVGHVSLTEARGLTTPTRSRSSTAPASRKLKSPAECASDEPTWAASSPQINPNSDSLRRTCARSRKLTSQQGGKAGEVSEKSLGTRHFRVFSCRKEADLTPSWAAGVAWGEK